MAYVLPGFTAIHGLPIIANSSAVWGTAASAADASFTTFVSGTVEAIAVGLTVSVVRWLIVDTLHHRTGLRPPPWDFALLDDNVAGFELLVHIHYWYYKFYANMVVALAWAYVTGGYALGLRGGLYGLLMILFWLGSRDALRKYYERAGRLLDARAKTRRTDR